MFNRTISFFRSAAAMIGLVAASSAPLESLARARTTEYPNPVLPAYEGSGGHRRGRGSGRVRGAPKGGIPGAGLWRKCRASGRVRGW